MAAAAAISREIRCAAARRAASSFFSASLTCETGVCVCVYVCVMFCLFPCRNGGCCSLILSSSSGRRFFSVLLRTNTNEAEENEEEKFFCFFLRGNVNGPAVGRAGDGSLGAQSNPV